MLCDVVRRRRRRRWAHAPVIHAASHFDHKKRVAWVSISMHTCGSFFYNYGAPLGGPSGRRSSAIRNRSTNQIAGNSLSSSEIILKLDRNPEYMFFLFLLENTIDEKKENTLLTLIIKM